MAQVFFFKQTRDIKKTKVVDRYGIALQDEAGRTQT